MMQSIETKNKVAFLGGTFNPPHLGHEHLFHEVSILNEFQKLIVVPVFISNFKRNESPVSSFHRVNMLRLAILDYKKKYPADDLEIEISEYECRSNKVSYSSDTVAHFFPLYNSAGFINWIIGDDIVKDLPLWHESEYLKKNVHFYCFTREGNGKAIYDNGFYITYVKSKPYKASSSDVRKGNMGAMSPSVRKYAEENFLY